MSPRRRLLLPCLLALSLAISGCSKQETGAAAAAGAKRATSIELVAAEAKGFTVGAMMSANAAYVFFDPQCPHCARLWEASVPLQRKAKFIWVPVGIINATSSSQGAALLSASDPARSMAEHEKSLLGGQGGISASSSVAPDIAQAIKNNTALFNSMGIESVPHIVAKNVRSGQMVVHSGSMDTAALADLLGIDPP